MLPLPRHGGAVLVVGVGVVVVDVPEGKQNSNLMDLKLTYLCVYTF